MNAIDLELEVQKRIAGIQTSSIFPWTWHFPSRTFLEETARLEIKQEIAAFKKEAKQAADADLKRKKAAERKAAERTPEELALDDLEQSITADIKKVSGATEELKRVNAKLNLIQGDTEALAKTVAKSREERERLLKKFATSDDFERRNLEMDILDLEETIEDENQNYENTLDHLNVLEGSSQALKLDIRNTNRRIRQHRSKLKQGRSLITTRAHVGNVDGYLKGISDESNMDNINLLIEEVKGDINQRLSETGESTKSRDNVSLRILEEANAIVALAPPVKETPDETL